MEGMRSFLSIYFTAGSILFCAPALPRVYINMGQAQLKKSLMALSPLVHEAPSSTSEDLKYGREIFSRIKKNLEFSGYFDFISGRAFIEDPTRVGVEPYPKDPRGFRWENWKLLNTEYLMLSRYTIQDNKVRLRVFMYDVLLRRPLFKKVYTSSLEQRVSLAHLVCNDIIENLTKKEAIFLTKIAAIRNTGRTKKEVFVMDWNGSRARQVTFHKSVVVAPSWFPSGQRLAYTAFVYRKSLKGRRANIFMYDFFSKKRRIVSSHYGTSLGADFFPSGRELLISLPSKFGGLDIFKFSVNRRRSFPLMMGPRGAINVEPSIHPDGRRIAFSSDRGGKVMLYEMNRYGDKLKQLTFVGSYNSSPDWSPDGNSLVFSGYSKGRFDIFIMNTSGPRKTRRLTTARKANGRWANNESPSFSPDGRHIVFTSDRSGVSQLYIMNIDGSNLRRITFDRYQYKSPKWSPLIKKFF